MLSLHCAYSLGVERPIARREAAELASKLAKRVSLAIYQALTARADYEAAGLWRAGSGRQGESRADRMREHELQVATLAHLRELAHLGDEMRAAMIEALGTWAIQSGVAAPGLSQREVEVIAQVSGSD